MSPVRLFLWTAVVVLAAAYLPFVAEILGYQLTGTLWNSLRLTAPWLSQTGEVLGGAVGGTLLGLAQWSILPRLRARWAGLLGLGGIGVGLAHAVYAPLTLLALPVAAALAALATLPAARFVRAQGISAAWVALALLLPFPRWAALALILGAALVSTWGVRAAYGPQVPSVR